MNLTGDIKFALRLMRKRPGFTLAIVFALALVNGVNTTIFSLAYSVMYRPLPYNDPGKLMMVFEQRPAKGVKDEFVSTADYLDWRQQNQVFENMGAFSGSPFDLTGINEPERLIGGRVSSSFLPTLGVNPVLGRLFNPEEDDPASQPVALLSYSLWKRRFAADPNVIGRKLILNDQPHTVVGVLPSDFHFLTHKFDLWVPLVFSSEQKMNRGMHHLQLVARLKTDQTLNSAQTNMDMVARGLEAQYPDKNTGHGAYVVPLRTKLIGDLRPALLILLAAVSIVMLIGCANIAGLLIVRATERKKEIAVRLALGVTRLQLIRQLCSESLLLVFSGGALGLLLAHYLVKIMALIIPVNPNVTPIPGLEDIRIDFGVYVFIVAVTLLTSLAFGLAPALYYRRVDVAQALNQGKAREGFIDLRWIWRCGNLLIIAELALAITLVTGAGLLIKSFQKIISADLGFRPEGVVTMYLTVPRLTGSVSEELQLKARFQTLRERLAGLRGVTAVGAVANLPLTGRLANRGITVEGKELVTGETLSTRYNVVSPGYLAAMRIPLVRGRDFNDRDTPDSTLVVLVNDKLAQQHWPDEDPIGKRIKLGNASSDRPWMTVVGVFKGVKDQDLRAEAKPEMYQTIGQFRPSPMSIVIATQSDPKALMIAARQAIQEVDEKQPVSELRMMNDLVSDVIAQPRLHAILLAIFAGLMVSLSVFGVFGVISYSLAQRRHELAVRLALGATQGSILGMIIRQGLLLVLIGLAAGLAGALAGGQLLRNLLYQVSGMDLSIVLLAVLTVTSAAISAFYVSARRCVKSDLMTSLRIE